MLIFTTTENGKTQTFEGFNAAFIADMTPPDVLVIATTQGTTELWKIDPNMVNHALEELARYYRMDGFEATITLYKKTV